MSPVIVQLTRRQSAGALACDVCILFVWLGEIWAGNRVRELPEMVTVARTDADLRCLLAGRLRL